MKTGFFLSALVAFGVLAAGPGHAQYHPPATTATKPVHASTPASPAIRHGSIGGPANKFGGINGTGKPPKH